MRNTPKNSAKIEDVAKAAGVSIMTVSRAMRGVDGVSIEKRQEILSIARSIGYYPNRVAVSLAASSSKLIGISVPTLFGTVFSEIYEGMRGTFERAGFQTVFDVTDYSQEQEERWVERMISWRPAGVVLTGVHHTATTRERLKSSGIPTLEIWDYVEDPIDLCIGVDHFAAGFAMGRYLAEQGYRRPSYLGIRRGKDTRSEKRANGLAAAFGEIGVKLDHQKSAIKNATFESGFRATEQVLSRNELKPDVLCFLNDNMAFGGLMCCRASKLSCPDDIGIVGYNGLNINQVLEKPLTTSLTPRKKMGSKGAEMLTAKIVGARINRTIAMPVKIEPGATTRLLTDIS